ncbi:unnamed protein product [Closterium sp. NIES-53]
MESSQCFTLLESANNGTYLHASVPLPAIVAAALALLGVKGAHKTQPGANAQQLARVVAAAVLAGELSLCSALASGHLVQAHLKYNRSTLNATAASAAVSVNAAAPAAAAAAVASAVTKAAVAAPVAAGPSVGAAVFRAVASESDCTELTGAATAGGAAAGPSAGAAVFRPVASELDCSEWV